MKHGGWLVWMASLGLGACGGKQESRVPATAAQAPAEPRSNAAELDAIRRGIDEAKALSLDGQDQRAEATARQAARRASALSRREPLLQSEALAQLASCLVVLKRTAEARQLIQQGLALAEPGSLEGLKRHFQLQMTLAESFRYEKRPDHAVAPFRAAIEAASSPKHERELTSRHAEAARRLAATFHALDRLAEAAAVLERALQSAQRHANEGDRTSLTMQLGFTYLQLHGLEKTLALLGPLGVRGRRLRASDMAFSDVSIDEFLPSSGPGPATLPSPAAPGAAALSPKPPARNTPAVSSAAQRVEQMRADFRTCYQTSLASDPSLRGSARLIMKVAADGRVGEVKSLGIGLPVETVDCLLRRAAEAQFDPPDGGSAVIAVPVTFVQR